MDSTGQGVHCDRLERSFDSAGVRQRVLKGVRFDAEPGQLTMLIGPSGCGKTTLISIIAGLLGSDGGSVRVLGHDLTRLDPKQLLDFRLRRIGFVFQQYNLIWGLSAAENVAVPLVAAGMAWPDALEQARAMLGRLGLGEQTHKLPRQLSSGQQQRVAIARALVHDPDLLLCDEPTAALDARSGHQVMELLRAVAVRPGRVVIVVSHDQRVFSFADRIAEMDDGLVVRVEERVAAPIAYARESTP
jgi:putative ABC transport system ATP-binding protein